MSIDFTLQPGDVAAARLLAVGIRPPLELGSFAAVVALLLTWSVSPWNFDMLPLVIGLAASLAAFRLTQIEKVKASALAEFQRNPTLRRPTTASWDQGGVTVQPAGALSERILWGELRRFKENRRVVVLVQDGGLLHAIPKRAFPDQPSLAAFRRLAARRGR